MSFFLPNHLPNVVPTRVGEVCALTTVFAYPSGLVDQGLTGLPQPSWLCAQRSMHPGGWWSGIPYVHPSGWLTARPDVDGEEDAICCPFPSWRLPRMLALGGPDRVEDGMCKANHRIQD